MMRFEQVVQVAEAAENGLSPLASALTLVVMTATVVTIAVLLSISMWRNRES